MPDEPQSRLDWAVAERCMPGELTSGDTHLVLDHDRGTLAAVIDGLGHGEHAAAASTAARTALAQSPQEPVDQLMRRCDQALTRTRGAAVTLAQINGAGMRWLAIGNVAAIVVRRDPNASVRHLPMRGGIVGSRFPNIRDVDHVSLGVGDVVVLATDGLRSGFSRAVDTSLSSQALADGLLNGFARVVDDALVLVVRCIGAIVEAQ